MLLLFEETPGGLALSRVKNEGEPSNVEDLDKEFSSPDLAPKGKTKNTNGPQPIVKLNPVQKLFQRLLLNLPKTSQKPYVPLLLPESEMLLLFESASRFYLFRVLDEGKLSNVEDLDREFATIPSARNMVALIAYQSFDSISQTVAKLQEGDPSEGLFQFLRDNHQNDETLGVADRKLGHVIKEKLNINCIYNNAVMALLRGVRSQFTALTAGGDLAAVSSRVSYVVARDKLLSSAQVEPILIQAIRLLDDLDTQTNTYSMRLREWYGWHFPELANIIPESIRYVKSVRLMGDKINAANTDFSTILTEDAEAKVKEASITSMGTEFDGIIIVNILRLCDQITSLVENRFHVYELLKSRMRTVAPNLTALVGELVGARLISQGGSLLKLSKKQASSIQILGAERALFRSLKRRPLDHSEALNTQLADQKSCNTQPQAHVTAPKRRQLADQAHSEALNTQLADQKSCNTQPQAHVTAPKRRLTPKYGFIYRTDLVGQSGPKHKGKIARLLAAKAAMCIRIDALGGGKDNSNGVRYRDQVEKRLKYLQRKDKRKPERLSGGLITSAQTAEQETEAVEVSKAEKKAKNKKASEEPEKELSSKKKSKKKAEAEETEAVEVSKAEKKSKNKKAAEEPEKELSSKKKSKKKAEAEKTEAVEVSKAEKFSKNKKAAEEPEKELSSKKSKKKAEAEETEAVEVSKAEKKAAEEKKRKRKAETETDSKRRKRVDATEDPVAQLPPA